LQPQCNLKQLKTLDLSKNIISGTASLAVMEINLSMSKTFESPTIRSVFKGENGQIGYSVVNILVKRFMDSFGFATKMSDTQIEVLTVDTLEKFSFETLEDVILFFKMARTGKFGSTMRGVDSNLIFGEWHPIYLEMKAEVREREYYKQKTEQNPVLTIDEVHKAYEKQKNSGQKYWDKVQERIDEITNGFDRQQLEDLILVWEKDESKAKFMHVLRKKRLDIKGDYKF